MQSGDNEAQQELSVLLADYQAARDDNREQQTQMVTLLGVSIALLAGVYVVVLQSAPFNTSASALQLNPVITFLIPTVPLIILAYTIWCAAGVALRGYYSRALERAILARQGVRIALHRDIQAPVSSHLEALLFRPRTGFMRMRALSNLVFIAPFILYAAVVILTSLTLKSLLLRACLIGLYVGLSGFAFWVVWTTSVDPRRFFLRLYERVPTELDRPLDAPRKKDISDQRQLWSYLLLPRLAESLKSVLFLVAAALTALAYGLESSTISAVLIYWFIFEFLAYQARYALNDLRGLPKDRAHPASAERGRLPDIGPLWFQIAVTEAMIIIRVSLAVIALWILPTAADRRAGAIFLAALLVMTISYEIIRSVAAKQKGGRCAGAWDWVVYAGIGLGYGLRGAVGSWFGSTGRIGTASEGLAFAMYALLGMGGVLVVWLYEAEEVHKRSGLASGLPSHINVLPNYIGRSRSNPSRAPKAVSPIFYHDVLSSPWGISFFSAFVLAGAFGSALWITRSDISEISVILVSLCTILASAALGLLTFRLDATKAILAGICIPLLAVIIDVIAGHWPWALLALPFLFCQISYASVRLGNYDQLVQGILLPLKQVRLLALGVLAAFQRIILGRDTSTILANEIRRRSKG